MSTFLSKRFDQLLVAGILAGIVWVMWFASLITGTGAKDFTGQLIGTDYVLFYAAGETVARGNEHRLYDFAFQKELQQRATKTEFEGFYPYYIPPFAALLFAPFAQVDYRTSYFAWLSVGLALLFLVSRWLAIGDWRRSFIWCLTWYPVFTVFSFGQNSLLTLFILTLCYLLWQHDRHFLAGLVASLSLYKPHLFLGVLLFWCLEFNRDKQALFGLAVGGAVLAGISFHFLPGASNVYLSLVTTVLPSLDLGAGFPLAKQHTLYALWLMLFSGNTMLAAICSWLCKIMAVAVFIVVWWRNRERRECCFALAMVLTFWLTPYAMIYDLALLILPAMVLWEHAEELREDLKSLFALLWFGALLGSSLTMLQLDYFESFAIHLSELALVVASVWLVLLMLRRGSLVHTNGISA